MNPWAAPYGSLMAYIAPLGSMRIQPWGLAISPAGRRRPARSAGECAKAGTDRGPAVVFLWFGHDHGLLCPGPRIGPLLAQF